MSKKYSKRKKSLIAIAPTLTATAITMLVRGEYYVGGTLLGIATVMFVVYDYLQERGADASLPAGIDSETFVEVAEVVGNRAEDYRDSKK